MSRKKGMGVSMSRKKGRKRTDAEKAAASEKQKKYWAEIKTVHKHVVKVYPGITLGEVSMHATRFRRGRVWRSMLRTGSAAGTKGRAELAEEILRARSTKKAIDKALPKSKPTKTPSVSEAALRDSVKHLRETDLGKCMFDESLGVAALNGTINLDLTKTAEGRALIEEARRVTEVKVRANRTRMALWLIEQCGSVEEARTAFEAAARAFA